MTLNGTLLFHLNLNYSAIEVGDRGEVIRRCYWPLLRLCRNLPWLVIAVEASAYTLEEIERLDQDWIVELRALIHAGRVEFIGCGDTQLIGPLVPAAVNRWNQRLGQETYERLLGIRPANPEPPPKPSLSRIPQALWPDLLHLCLPAPPRGAGGV